ncbi:CRISPR-associated endoribonuclease Cas6 [Candidatus Dependentiae bacterium]|nr:CRISPR-associated endoribonuclease Cas6 [Candidatus Dependentiae bacterium]
MRIKVTLSHIKGRGFDFPVNYNYIIQSFIYNHLSPKISNFIHEKGYSYGKRKYRMFNFSRLIGDYNFDKRTKSLKFKSSFSFIISSPDIDFVSDIANNLINKDICQFFDKDFNIVSIEVFKEPKFENSHIIKMISPVVVYQTLYTIDKKKKTYYYSPVENEFSDLVNDNISRKFQAFYKIENKKRKITITPLGHKSFNKVVINYKGTYINAFYGVFKLTGNKKLIKLSYYSGLGSKNSQGFGMFEIKKEN